MAFTATITSINLQNDTFVVGVVFNDSVSGFTSNRTYSFDASVTQAQVVSQITTDGTALKTNLTKNNSLQSKLGTIITI